MTYDSKKKINLDSSKQLQERFAAFNKQIIIENNNRIISNVFTRRANTL